MVQRRKVIKQLKGMEDLSIRQIVGITGLTYHEICPRRYQGLVY